MNRGRIRWELAVLAVLCVMTIFLFPATQGPYSVVHGPASALQGARAAARLRMVIAQSALTPNLLGATLVVLFWILVANMECQSVGLPEYSTILRC